MAEFWGDLPKILSLFATLAMCGAMIAVGFAGVCKLIGWAPVNVTVNLSTKDADD